MMNKEFYSPVVLVFIGVGNLAMLVDWKFRSSMKLKYLLLSVILNTTTAKGKVRVMHSLDSKDINQTRYRYFRALGDLWIYCHYKRRDSTLGLLSRYNLDINGTINSVETRLSLGAIVAVVSYLVLIIVAFLGTSGRQLERFAPPYVFLAIFFVVFVIHLRFAYRRHCNETSETIALLSEVSK